MGPLSGQLTCYICHNTCFETENDSTLILYKSNGSSCDLNDISPQQNKFCKWWHSINGRVYHSQLHYCVSYCKQVRDYFWSKSTAAISLIVMHLKKLQNGWEIQSRSKYMRMMRILPFLCGLVYAVLPITFGVSALIMHFIAGHFVVCILTLNIHKSCFTKWTSGEACKCFYLTTFEHRQQTQMSLIYHMLNQIAQNLYI